MIGTSQLCTSDSPRFLVTSTDSKIRVADGADIVQKFKGTYIFAEVSILHWLRKLPFSHVYVP